MSEPPARSPIWIATGAIALLAICGLVSLRVAPGRGGAAVVLVLMLGVAGALAVGARRRAGDESTGSQVSVETMRGLTDEIPALLAVFDQEQRYEYANRTQQQLHRKDLEALEGRTVREVLGEAAYEEIRPYIERVLAGETVGFESRFPTADASRPLVFEASYVPRRNEDGAVTGFYSLAFDATDRYVVERERQDLERRVLQAQKLESLGVLAGGIAHDFNNLLVAMLASVGLVRAELRHGRGADEALDQIESAARRAAELCKQMLDYSGKGPAAPEPVDLSHLAREMGALLQVSLGGGVSLHFELAPEMPRVLADIGQMRQVLMSLVTNASESMTGAGGSITIRTGHVHADRADLAATFVDDALSEGEYAFVEVVDSGCGMSDEVRANLFDPFFSTKFTGRGLGLASALGIVRGHKGAIDVQSEVDRGSRIRVLLPVGESIARATVGSLLAKSEGSPTRNDIEGEARRRVLVIDDEPGLRRAAERILQTVGLDVVLAASGREGLDRLEAEGAAIDAVVLDLTMPGMDGAETLAGIRAIDADLPVLLCSGYTEDEVESRCRGLRYSGCLAKPFDYEGFTRAVLELLDE